MQIKSIKFLKYFQPLTFCGLVLFTERPFERGCCIILSTRKVKPYANTRLTSSAASFNSMAEKTLRPDSSIIFFAMSAFVP